MINLKNHSIYLLLVLSISITGIPAFSQSPQKNSKVQKKTNVPKSTTKISSKNSGNSNLDPQELESYKQKVSRMVSFLEFALNTIGSDSSMADDKDVIINKSYLKFFNDSKVQVEDDLTDNRSTVTYKNVQSYLQDLDYFYKDAKFELNVDAITSNFTDEKHPYFIAEVTRYLKGITVDGDSVRNAKKRFIEINLDLKSKDLKIASIYTTRYNEDEVLLEWWKGLNEDWKKIFSNVMKTNDSIKVPHLKRLLMTDSLDISKISNIKNLEPLNKLLQLKYLNISSTKIEDLTPVRNLVNLEVINCSFSPITSLKPLKYTVELKELYINNTNILDLTPITIFKKLRRLDFYSSPVSNINPLAELSNLEVLNAYSTPVNSINALKKLNNLKFLNVSSTGVEKLDSLSELENLSEVDLSFTKVTDLTPIKNLKKLSILNINNTSVNTLSPLSSNSTISKIYCDNTSISRQDATEFMNQHPKVLVIYQSVGLFEWWKNLGPLWQGIFRKYVSVHGTPTVEEMATIANLVELDISGIKEINTLAPLKPLTNLKSLYSNNTSIESLFEIESLTNIEILEVASTEVRDITPLNNFKNLKRLNVDNTPIKLEQLEILVKASPKCLVIYKTAALQQWWEKLTMDWKEVFQKYFSLKTLTPSTIELHQLVEADSLKIVNNGKIRDLTPLFEFLTLNSLEIENCNVENVDVLTKLGQIQTLKINKNPVKNIAPLKSLVILKSLDLENTAVSELEVLEYLNKLEVLNLAGTPIRDIKNLEKLTSLTSLDISSTVVSSLNPLEKSTNMKILRCYNSKVSSKKVEKFKKQHPQCEVVFY